MLNQWIILMIDRSALGSPILAVARDQRPHDRFGDKVRRTARLTSALKFANQRWAKAAAKRLQGDCPGWLLIVDEISESDFANRGQVAATAHADLFCGEEQPPC